MVLFSLSITSGNKVTSTNYPGDVIIKPGGNIEKKRGYRIYLGIDAQIRSGLSGNSGFPGQAPDSGYG
jgi:hypothetical protein